MLTLATAAIHFGFFVVDPTARGRIFAANALGYVLLLALLYFPWSALDSFRRTARLGLIGFAALTIVANIAFGLMRHERTEPLGPVDKLIEVVLIVLPWREDRQAHA